MVTEAVAAQLALEYADTECVNHVHKTDHGKHARAVLTETSTLAKAIRAETFGLNWSAEMRRVMAGKTLLTEKT